VIEFPYFSMITAYFFYQLAKSPKMGHLVTAQTVLMFAALACIAGLVYITGIQNGVFATAIAVAIVLAASVISYRNNLQQLLFKGYAMAAMLYIFLFQFFYPFLLQYQSGRQAAREIPEINKSIPVAEYGLFSYTFEFYSPGDVSLIRNGEYLQDFIDTAPCYLYTTETIADSLLKSGLDAEVLATPKHFHVTRLKIGFLNYKKRDVTLEPRYLLYIKDGDAVL
jgi:hypothetical protein